MADSEPTCLLIADISGYTSYLAGVELDHAQDILADLVGTVVSALRPAFRLAKLEGDAAFMAAPAAKLDGSLLLDAVERCYFGFRRRRRDVSQATSCECNACVRIPDLNLKFVAHLGPVARQRMAGLEELVGSDVIVVHRLLKNTIVETTGASAYAFFSQACVDAMGLEPGALGMIRHVESYEHIGEVAGWVDDLGRRWLEEDSRQRVRVEPAAALITRSVVTTAAPQVAWEFMTTPGRRVAWSAGVTDVIVDARGNRRGVGATNHCMHGKDAVIEEVLDWRPYDYYTIRSTMNTPGGPVKFISTFEFEPTPDGSIIHTRHAKPRTSKETAALSQMLPFFETIFEANEQALGALLDGAVVDQAGASGIEPPLPAPRSDGLFSEIQPLLIVG